jgi:hypothetical protein
VSVRKAFNRKVPRGAKCAKYNGVACGHGVFARKFLRYLELHSFCFCQQCQQRA